MVIKAIYMVVLLTFSMMVHFIVEGVDLLKTLATRLSSRQAVNQIDESW